MKRILIPSLALVISLTLTACNNNSDTNGISQQESSADNSQQEQSGYDRELVKFPENYDKGVNYTTVNRGNVREELYTSREVIEAVQNGQPIPDGTVITLEIYRDEELDEVFVMEKRTGWGDQTPQGTPRNGDWQYQEFNGDRSLDYEEDIGRCFSCHANQERDDFVNTLDEMKSYNLEDLTGSNDSMTESQIAGVPTNHWEVRTAGDKLEDSQDILHGNSIMGNEEKAGFIQKVLLMIHFNQET
ncbi:cytochrome P460 family protein [Cytobacillus pseudoceanisediminis]|uniref:cytochrome P460 family protein n=1 Tax=Cytobacillus pseudoceanisediminis TaxID=3051614 RepID=UPI003C302B0D